MRDLIRRLVPAGLLARYRERQRQLARRRNAPRSAEDVFTEIYRNNVWGGAPGQFYSGNGSADPDVVRPYLRAVADLARREGFVGRAFVDLGCGDFRVGRELVPLCSTYTGVDVVKPLVDRNQAAFGSDRVRFLHRDVARDELPDGEVCFVRQVLQHLSNDQIAAVLERLRQYRWVLVTEHYPSDNPGIRPNVDKVHGADVRLHGNSGVYLTEPPFNLPAAAVTPVLEVPGAGMVPGVDAGVIRTYLYTPARPGGAPPASG